MIDQAFYSILSNTTAITDIVGSEIYPQFNPQPTGIYLVYQGIDYRRPANIDNGPSQRMARYQIDSYGTNPVTVESLNEAVITALNYQSNTAYGHSIQLMRVDSERSDYEPETGYYSRTIDVSVFFD